MIHHHCASVPHKSPDGVHLVCPKEAAATFFALFLYSLSNDVNYRAEGEREIADRCHPPSRTNQSLHKQLICFPRVYADLTCPTYRIKNNVWAAGWEERKRGKGAKKSICKRAEEWSVKGKDWVNFGATYIGSIVMNRGMQSGNSSLFKNLRDRSSSNHS